MSTINFSNITLLGKGTVRKSNKGGTRESGFDVRYVNYVKNTTSGPQLVNHFVFSASFLSKTGLGADNKSATPFAVDGIVGIAVLNNPTDGVFLKPATKGAKKSKNVSVPSLVASLSEANLLDKDFSGSQYFDVEQVGKDEHGTYFKLVPSAEVAPKPYVAEQEEGQEQEGE